MGEIPADYELNEPAPRPSISGRQMALIIAAVVIALGALSVATVTFARTGNAGNSQTAEIRELDKSAIRQASEIAALKTQLAQLSGKLQAADPADDSDLITCRDIKHMNLTVTTGASIEAGGSIGLGQSPVPLPAHCPK